jgi:hypothetical protein
VYFLRKAAMQKEKKEKKTAESACEPGRAKSGFIMVRVTVRDDSPDCELFMPARLPLVGPHRTVFFECAVSRDCGRGALESGCSMSLQRVCPGYAWRFLHFPRKT